MTSTYKSAIAILTYRRINSLRLFLEQILKECPDVPIAVFEDCGQTDETEDFLLEGAEFIRRDHTYAADVYKRGNATVFLSHYNAGVCGNSNKAIKWFMDETDAEHLCLCNDDLEASGPFHLTYAEAHKKLEVGLLCFSDFTSDAYKFVTIPVRGLKVKMLTRMTGIMMSMTRALVADIGYYDAQAFTFGQEHCDFNNRARLRGFINLNGQGQYSLDVPCPFIKHQEVASSLTDAEKQTYNNHADEMIEIVAKSYYHSDLYRPFSIGRSAATAAGRDGIGTPIPELSRSLARVRSNYVDSDLVPMSGLPSELVGTPSEAAVPPAPVPRPTVAVEFVDEVGGPSDRLG